jgi:hypothetical protein
VNDIRQRLPQKHAIPSEANGFVSFNGDLQALFLRRDFKQPGPLTRLTHGRNMVGCS